MARGEAGVAFLHGGAPSAAEEESDKGDRRLRIDHSSNHNRTFFPLLPLFLLLGGTLISEKYLRLFAIRRTLLPVCFLSRDVMATRGRMKQRQSLEQ